jgi:hypothetical protein
MQESSANANIPELETGMSAWPNNNRSDAWEMAYLDLPTPLPWDKVKATNTEILARLNASQSTQGQLPTHSPLSADQFPVGVQARGVDVDTFLASETAQDKKHLSQTSRTPALSLRFSDRSSAAAGRNRTRLGRRITDDSKAGYKNGFIRAQIRISS